MPKKTKEKEIYWEGRSWRISLVPHGVIRTEDVNEKQEGTLRPSENVISARYVNDDNAILTLLHEMLHQVIKTGSLGLSEDTEETLIERGEVMVKTFLEAFGVDLTPMLKGYK